MRFIDKKYIPTYLFFLAILIYAARTFFGYGSVLTLVCKLYVILMGIYSVVSSNFFSKSSIIQKRMINALILIVLIAIIYYFLFPKYELMRGVMLGDMASSMSQLNLLIYSVSGFFVSAFLTRRRLLNDEIIKVFFVLYCLVSICVFFRTQNDIYELTGASVIVNNAGYIIIAVFPLCFLYKKPLMLLYMALALVFSLMSAKRGAALQAGLLCLIAVISQIQSLRSGGKRILFIGVIIIISCIMLSVFIDEISPIIERLERDGLSSSGRDVILLSIVNQATNSFWNLIFGGGALASVRAAGNFAHNDFMEIFASFGLIGLCALIYFYYQCYKTYRKIRIYNKTYALIMLFSVFACVFRSLISMLLYMSEGVVSMFIIGYIAGSYSNYLQDYEIKKNSIVR